MLEIRAATPADVPTIFHFIYQLAIFEQLPEAVTGTAAQLALDLFGPRPWAEVVLAIWAGEAVGFALFFPTYSTFLTRPGLHLEDLFVMPDYRGRGIGRALLTHVGALARARGCGRLEWAVLDWNAGAIAFYERMGATVLPDWRICRVEGESLDQLAASSPV